MLSSRMFSSLLASEDFDAFELATAEAARSVGLEAMRECVEAFDAGLAARPMPGWSVHERAPRTLVTLLGAMTYTRTVFLDRLGRRRALCDELLGVPKRARLSAGAFLWMCRCAAELSYRKTAAAFAELSGARVSHVTVMRCVHEEGALLKSARRPRERVSQGVLHVEADGLWVRLQEESHRGARAAPLPLRAGQAHALLRAEDGVRLRRQEEGGAGAPRAGRPVADLRGRLPRRVLGARGEHGVRGLRAGRPGEGRPRRRRRGVVRARRAGGRPVARSLDPFHIMQKIWRAFPEGAQREWAVNLAVRRKPLQLARMCARVAAKAPDPARARKVRELGSYMEANADAVRFPTPSLGTMEGTNAHVGAARLKGLGRSWSRRGAEAMCLIRCALACGRPLVAPPKQAFFTERGREAAGGRPRAPPPGSRPRRAADTSRPTGPRRPGSKPRRRSGRRRANMEPPRNRAAAPRGCRGPPPRRSDGALPD